MILPALSMLRAVPHGAAVKLATYALAFVLGLWLGNHWATREAMEAQRAELLRYAAEREAAVGEAYAMAQREFQDRLNAAAERERKADAVAHEVYQAGIRASAKGKADVERKLAAEFSKASKMKEANDGLLKVNEMLASEMAALSADPGCIMPAGVRQTLNAYIARANNRAGIGGPEAEAAGLLIGPDRPDSLLACTDLAASLIDVINHDATMISRSQAWKAWATEALR